MKLSAVLAAALLSTVAASAAAGEACTLERCVTPTLTPTPALGATALDSRAREAILLAAQSAASVPARAKAANDGKGDAWDRQLGRGGANAAGREAYDCALGVGVGGALSRDGFIGTRALGRTQVWRPGQ